MDKAKIAELTREELIAIVMERDARIFELEAQISRAMLGPSVIVSPFPDTCPNKAK